MICVMCGHSRSCQYKKLVELVEKHRKSCPERWCHCKSAEFDDILGEQE